jgi:hypothetical protein
MASITKIRGRSASAGQSHADEEAAVELALYLDNEEPIYRQKLEIAKNLERKLKKGTYDHKRAPDLWIYAVERAAKSYAKEFADPKEWFKLFPPDVRRVVAQELADRWYANAKAGRPDEV